MNVNQYTGELIQPSWEIRYRQKHRERFGKGNTSGIKYGYIRNGKYFVDSAYCYKCDFGSPLNGRFPSICSKCPSCGNKACRWNPPRKALALRKMYENATKENRRNYLQWCHK